jgi:transposase
VLVMQMHRQQLPQSAACLQPLMRRTLAALRRELTQVDRAVATLVKQHTSPALQSGKGLGPVFQATSLALLPELGTLDRRQIASWSAWHR